MNDELVQDLIGILGLKPGDAERAVAMVREYIALDIEDDAEALQVANPGNDLMAFAATWLRNGAVVAREGRQLSGEEG